MFSSFNARAVGLSLPVEETIEVASSAGFGGVDLLVRDLVDAGTSPTELRRRMNDLGLTGGAWPLPVDWRGDRDAYERDLGRLPRLAEAASQLGLSRTGTWVLPETPEKPFGEEARSRHSAETIDFHLRRLIPVARILEDHGTRLGLEVIGVESSRSGRGLPFVHRLADVGLILDALRGEVPSIGLVVDAFHLYAAAEDVSVALAWGVDSVVWVHVADLPPGSDPDRSLIRDGQRGLPSERGIVDVSGLLAALADGGYSGPITAEPLALEPRLARLDPPSIARQVARALCSVWPENSPPMRRS